MIAFAKEPPGATAFAHLFEIEWDSLGAHKSAYSGSALNTGFGVDRTREFLAMAPRTAPAVELEPGVLS